MPIKDASGDVVGVAQVINKLSGDQKFTENDEKVRISTKSLHRVIIIFDSFNVVKFVTLKINYPKVKLSVLNK